jgi:hypothetical protein
VIESINTIINRYGQKDQEFIPEVALLIKTAARILATVMNQIQARAQFLEHSVQPLVTLMNLMAINKVFESSSPTGQIDQIEFVANGLKVVRLLTTKVANTSRIKTEFENFVQILDKLLTDNSENEVI